MQHNRGVVIPKSKINSGSIQKSFSLSRSPTFQMKQRINEKDACTIEVPFEMSCIGNIDIRFDGQDGTVLRVFEEDATVLLSNEKEIVTVPIFCIKKKTYVFKKREEIVENVNSPSKSTSKKLKENKKFKPEIYRFSI